MPKLHFVIMLWDLGLVAVRSYFDDCALPFVHQTVDRAKLEEQTHSHTFVYWEKSAQIGHNAKRKCEALGRHGSPDHRMG